MEREKPMAQQQYPAPADARLTALIADYLSCDAPARARIRDLVRVIADAPRPEIDAASYPPGTAPLPLRIPEH